MLLLQLGFSYDFCASLRGVREFRARCSLHPGGTTYDTNSQHSTGIVKGMLCRTNYH